MASYLTGIDLHEFLENPMLSQDAIIEGFIFKDTINIFYSEPGAGKSVLGVNMLASMSTGSPVFGHFQMKGAVKSSFLQLEGSRDEQLGRFKEMTSEIPVNLDNICWHDSPVFVESEESQENIIKELLEYKPQVIFIDSFYCLTSKGLSKEEAFLPVRQMIKTLKAKTGATIIILHHTQKDQYEKGKKVAKSDPFLGSQYVKAFADFMLYITKDGENRLILKATKMSRNNEGVKKITLEFNKTNWTLKAVTAETCKSAIGHIKDFLEIHFKKEDSVSLDLIMQTTGLSKRHIRRLKNDGYFDNSCEFIKTKNNEVIWRKK